MSAREGGRKPDQLRAISFEPDYLENPHGSVVITQGRTKVLCTAMVEEEVPRWLRNKGRGWITAEYSLLPASTGERVQREAARGKQQGRTVEIQRLIGRAIRAVADFEALGERTLWLDCDVLQADGGTRCAAICGAYVAAIAGARSLRPLAHVPRLGRRRLGRRRRRRAAPRPRLLRGLERRHGHERRDDRRRTPRRGTGDRRARSVRPRDARRAARPSGGRDRRDRRAPGRGGRA